MYYGIVYGNKNRSYNFEGTHLFIMWWYYTYGTANTSSSVIPVNDVAHASTNIKIPKFI